MKNYKNIIKIILFLLVMMFASTLSHINSEAAFRISKKKLSLYQGDSYYLCTYGAKKKCKWSSSNKNIATVSKYGRVKAKKSGKATIKVKSAGKTRSCKVTVKKWAVTPVETSKTNYSNTSDNRINSKSSNSNSTKTVKSNSGKSYLDKYNVEVQVNDREKVIIKKADIDDKVQCVSSNTSVATITYSYELGFGGYFLYINGVSEGTAVITVKVNDQTMTCNVTVRKALVIENKDIDLPYHNSGKININVDSSEVAFTSSNENIVTVDNTGAIYGKKCGYAYIKVSYCGKLQKVDINVSFKGLDLSCNSYVELCVGETGNFGFNSTNEEFMKDFNGVLTSDIPSICEVDKDGNLYAKSNGYTMIHMYIDNKYALVCNVHVYDFNIPEEETLFRIGDTERIQCHGIQYGDYQVTSCDESIIKVEDNGYDIIIEAMNSGTTELIYTCRDFSQRRTVRVAKGVVESIKTNDYENYNESERQILQEIRAIIDRNVSPGMTTEQKVKAIHDYLVLNCDYDYYSYQSGEVPKVSYSYVGVFRNRKAVCNGYAQAFALCMKVLDIPCRMITGGAGDGGHAWNQVCVDGTWYYIDVTWDDPIINGGIDPNYIRWTYYLSQSLWADHVAYNVYDTVEFEEFLNPEKLWIVGAN